MRRIAQLGLALALLLVGNIASGQTGREAELVRGWYRDYLGREVGPELTAWVEMLRGGMSPVDLQATILGSDEFYYQKGRDPQTFVLETLQAVTWSEPTVSELRRWTNRLDQLQGDRLTLVREILQSTATPQSNATQVSELGTRLASAARLVVESIDFEIAGTPQGRQANLQARALYDAATQFQQAVALRTYRQEDALLALHNADRAYQSLQTTLSNPPGTAPGASGFARRVGTMLSEARMLIRPTTPPPGTPTTGGSYGYDQQKLLGQTQAMSRAVQSLSQMLSSQAYQSYAYGVVLRELDAFAARIDSFDQAVRQGTPRNRLEWEFTGLSDTAARIAPQLKAGRQPYFVRLYWQSVESSLEQMQTTLGVSGDPSTVLRPTPLAQELLPLLDQAISQIDVFLAGTNQLVFGIPEVPSVQSNIRNLKTRVLTLRQEASTGEPASVLKQTLSAMVGDYQRAFDRWNQIVASRRLINPARLSPVGETLNRVERLIDDALASGPTTPTGSGRTNQLLAALGSEVAAIRQSLVSFGAYQEKRSLDLYCEQLDGYVQSIGDALVRPTTVDARRLAVAMQGVVGRMQTDANSLSQRAAAAGTQSLRQRAGDIELRTQQIGRLVDEIETELY